MGLEVLDNYETMKSVLFISIFFFQIPFQLIVLPLLFLNVYFLVFFK